MAKISQIDLLRYMGKIKYPNGGCAVDKSVYLFFIKPCADKVFSLILLILLLPIISAISLALAISLKGNPFFTQERGGFKGEVFKIIKFRTMTNEIGNNGTLLPDDRRLTNTGKIVRSLSLDEIPQLINIFKGDMSFIGPRPFLSEYLVIYSNEEKKRHEVKPGLTGWAQVNGRNSLSWKEKFRLDLEYVKKISLMIDINILLKTFVKVFYVSSVNQDKNVTMEKYNGKN